MAKLRNDKGQEEGDDHCGTGPLGLVCTWDDIQSWSRELAKRRARAFIWLNAYDKGTAPEVPAALAEQLRAWANSPTVRDESKLSDQTFGPPSEEHVEQIIGLIRTGDELLRRVSAVDPTTGPVLPVPEETAQFRLRWWHLAMAGAAYYAVTREPRFANRRRRR
jgi:hypothetical protein